MPHVWTSTCNFKSHGPWVYVAVLYFEAYPYLTSENLTMTLSPAGRGSRRNPNSPPLDLSSSSSSHDMASRLCQQPLFWENMPIVTRTSSSMWVKHLNPLSIFAIGHDHIIYNIWLGCKALVMSVTSFFLGQILTCHTSSIQDHPCAKTREGWSISSSTGGYTGSVVNYHSRWDSHSGTSI